MADSLGDHNESGNLSFIAKVSALALGASTY